MRNTCLLILLLAATAAGAGAQSGPIDPERAARYFEEARSISAIDGGRLWGVPLYGPMMFVDPATSTVVASQADKEGKLTQQGAVWAGKLPPEIGAANTSIEWLGVRWTMVMWPVPIYPKDRASLMMHESFHRVQSQIGLPARDAVNSHLDTRDGRIFLELEWRALERALEDWANPPRRNLALADALLFRARRRQAIAGSAEKENALEMNEGLAQFTGERLANPKPEEMREAAINALKTAGRRKSYARSFAYVSGPVYGVLLDMAPQPAGGQSWRKSLTPDTDFAALIENAYGIEAPQPSSEAVKARLGPYNGSELIAQETAREEKQKAAIAAARARFVDGPLLILPVVHHLGYSFDPNNVVALDENLTLYTPVKVSDDWGVLNCEKGGVMAREKGSIVRAQVPAPADPAARPVKLDGCTLDLHEGWTIAPGERDGDYILKETP